MIRFIFNFIFFGVLFYAIWIFFPDAFTTLVSWAQSIYSFLVDIGAKIFEWISDLTKPGSKGGAEKGSEAMLLFSQLSVFWR